MSQPAQLNQVNINEITANANTDHYMNMMINSHIASQISKFNAANGFNYKNITTLILLLSIGELKNLVKYFTSNTSTFVIENYKTFFTSVYSFGVGIPKMISSSFNNLFGKKITYSLEEKLVEPIKQEYVIDGINEFVKGLVFYLEDDKNSMSSSYSITNSREIKIENMESIVINEEWNDIIIYYLNTKIILNSKLNLTFDKTGNLKKQLKNFSQTTTENTDSKYKVTEEKLEKLIKSTRSISGLVNDRIISNYIVRLCNKMPSNYIAISPLTSSNLEQWIEEVRNRTGLYSKDNIEIYIFLIISYHFPYITSTQDVIKELSIISYVLGLMRYVLSFKFNRTNDNFKLFFFDKECTKLYFLDLHLKVPQHITKMLSNLEDLKDLYKSNNFTHKFLNETYVTFEDYYGTNKQVKTIYGEKCGIGDYILLSNTLFYESIKRFLILNSQTLYVKKINKENILLSDTIFTIILNSTGPGTCSSIDFINTNLYIPLECINITDINSKDKLKEQDTKTSSTKLNFVCEALNKDLSLEETNNIFNNFIDTIKSFGLISNLDKTTINICKIKLNKKEVKTEIPNPDYQSYLEKKEMIEKMINPSNQSHYSNSPNQSNTSEIVIKELSNIPPKTICQTRISKEIVSEIINSDFKSFDTMYLREADEKKLLSVLSKFKSNKELLKSLGLPNKLCVMLDGLPGTGKSSTILTIASYLKKDIYYLSFGDTIETNEDLQMIFDHVVKNCNGGIIVAEDIDAVGTLACRIKNSQNLNQPQNTIEVVETTTQKLSLAYVLNLLQGTITPDNLIFIATTNHIEKLDPAFYRHGRFDVRITFKLADHYQMNKIYNKFFQRSIPNNLIGKIAEDKYTPAQFIFTIKDYISEDFTDEVILQDFLN